MNPLQSQLRHRPPAAEAALTDGAGIVPGTAREETGGRGEADGGFGG
jgi:hypothetical protein